jgi:hypothetical protein
MIKIKMKGAAKKQRMQRENMETLGTPELCYFLGLEVLGTTWLTLGTWHFIFLAPLGTQLDFILFLFCRFCKIIFSQDGGNHV